MGGGVFARTLCLLVSDSKTQMRQLAGRIKIVCAPLYILISRSQPQKYAENEGGLRVVNGLPRRRQLQITSSTYISRFVNWQFMKATNQYQITILARSPGRLNKFRVTRILILMRHAHLITIIISLL